MMGGLLAYLLIYVVGGLTLIPLLLLLLLLHAHLTFPTHDASDREHDTSSIIRPGDDIDAITSAQKTLGEKFQPGTNHEADVFAGYFAVCREYVPSGVNGRPPERATPIGSAVVSAPSPSVYQSMYRSIFERKPTNSPLDTKGVGKAQKKGGNVFYVVLRHGHLMLFDNDEQLEVRHVVSLAHHHVSIYSGGDETPEGELFIKRNALCLSRKTGAGEIAPDGPVSQPFFFFSEKCSEKEDFYFALLRNQERKADPDTDPPLPLQYDVKDIITLVQRLHSSEEHLQTRWINAVIGRIFLALYKTTEVENLVRAKITKKISRVKTPSFLSKITLRNIDMGEAAPVITNPRLKDLTVDGELVVEADLRYSGNFRMEVATTARIELGSRFKAREVNLLLAVVVKRVEGHVLMRIKPPPSNRIWVTFQTMPKIDMSVFPIVSSRQITYTLILRQIENRIKEVVAESLVYPYWDDSPFYSTESKRWRGGIWADERTARPQDVETVAAESGDVEEVEHLEAGDDEAIMALPQFEKSSSSMPVGDTSPATTVFSRKAAKSASNLSNTKASGSSTSIETRSSESEKPRALRSASFVSASSPIVSTDVTNADAFKHSSSPEHGHATSAIAAMSALSQTNSPGQTPIGSPRVARVDSQSSISSEKDIQHESSLQPSINVSEITSHSVSSSYPPSPTSVSGSSLKSDPPSVLGMGLEQHDSRRENSTSSSGKSSTAETKRLSLAAVTNAAATAKKWGWNAIQRHGGDLKGDVPSGSSDTHHHPLVMGRGQPLPPPGVPLPPPNKKTKTAPIPVPKRKAVIPPPELPLIPKSIEPNSRHKLVAPPPLPKRRSLSDTRNEVAGEGLLVVAAPAVDSEPTTPTSEHAPTYIKPWVDDVDGDEEEVHAQYPPSSPPAPRLPSRRPHRALSGSPEEDGHKLPSWLAAQEEEARAKSSFVDEDSGV
ncbi:hypothetical protein B7494_g6069 [Chlorociboria aeruginascens]|nr:hypothetical protein B7494_g6069 [Chlorociboria aeruginascens]